jgi:hypothetical protein
LHYNNIYANKYFWRTQQQQEIDYLEERDESIHAFEIKWNPGARARFPLTFSKAYPQSKFELLTPGNYHSFLGKEQ